MFTPLNQAQQNRNQNPSSPEMERRILRPAHSYKIFREDCGFTMEDWTSLHEMVQNALLEPRNYVALQKPYVHRQAWEGWLQTFIDATGLVDVYCIRAFLRDLVIAVAKEISRARNKIAREISYVKNIEPPEFPALAQSQADDLEPDALYNVKMEGPSGAPGMVGNHPLPGSVMSAANVEDASAVVNSVAPIAAPPSPFPPGVPPCPSPGEPSVKLRPVREVVDIERYDPDAPIELIPEGYVKQFVIDDDDNGHHNIILLKDPAYNSSSPKKHRAKEQLEIRNSLSNDDPQNLPSKITSSSPAPATTTPYPPWGNRAQGWPAETPESLPRLTLYSSSREDTPVPAEGKHGWVAGGDNTSSRGRMGIKHEIESDDDDEGDEDYRGDDGDETAYARRGGTGTDIEGEREFAFGISRGHIRRHKYSLRKRLQVL
ncbi:hypothetical protein C7212DRAFT_342273 [Tuber magnatum]|uniref:Uncharacterized protein n=1 Tax=Tuber magnatum TaxID=42249 RepID=A0A317SU81_9PEZI|nr:hypothetical protein C7212DRAFT_342273 [Tuber magnatum]